MEPPSLAVASGKSLENMDKSGYAKYGCKDNTDNERRLVAIGVRKFWTISNAFRHIGQQ